MEELTPKVLRDLYLGVHLTEKEIARQFGTYQVRVGRLRRKWGIPTLSKTERVSRDLPDLTEQQHCLVVGSLLGDGWMRASSDLAAGFNEGHCLTQSGYTDWKADLMGAFTSSRYAGTKTDCATGRVYHSRSFSTACCSQLRPYYDLFYPAPHRKRVFPASLHELMTPFVLAVWYMDDGNCTKGNEPRIAFGLDDLSLKRALRALRVLGLKPKVYGKGSGKAIHFPKQRVLFRELIDEHIPSCMAYKIPIESDGQATHRNALKLTPGEAGQLYLGGLSKKDIASVFGVGVSTVSRRLASAGVSSRRPGPRVLEYTVDAAEAALQGPRDGPHADIEARALAVLSATPFPFPKMLSAEDVHAEYRKVCKAGMSVVDGVIVPLRRVGLRACYPFFPNRYKARYRGNISAYTAWHDERHLRRAIRWQLRTGDPVVPKRVVRAVAANCRTPTVFRPMVARYLYDCYCPSGGTVWDPCAGFGGRLMGAAAAGVHYVATDVDPETIEGNRSLAECLGVPVDLHLCPAEDFEPPDVDLVFTSPPYYHQEQYVGGSQSWKSYPTIEEWDEGFLRPLLVNARRAVLARDGKVALNIADVKNHNGVVPLESLVQEAAIAAGLRLEETLRMPLSKLNRRNPWEPIFVWKIDPDQDRSGQNTEQKCEPNDSR